MDTYTYVFISAIVQIFITSAQLFKETTNHIHFMRPKGEISRDYQHPKQISILCMQRQRAIGSSSFVRSNDARFCRRPARGPLSKIQGGAICVCV